MTDRKVSLSEMVTQTSVGQGDRPGGLTPVRLPGARDQVARFIADPDGPLAENFPQHRGGFDLTVRHLRAAELYWVTPDMAALAVSAGAQLDSIRWTTADRPSGCGLVLFASGVGMASVQGAELPVDAMSWGPAPGGIAVTMFCGRWRIDPSIGERVLIDLPPLLVATQHDVGGGDGETPVDTLTEKSRVLVCTLAATWALMQQPTIVDRHPGPIDRGLARSYRRAGRPDPAVSIIDLRSIYRPDREEQPDSPSRIYRHRWVVRGHWRDQAHGPGRELRRRIYVPAYIKGPDGAPLLQRERVNVWRR